MADIKDPLAGVTFETKGIPVLYANQANPSISFNDIRIYFSDVSPKEVSVATPKEVGRIAPTVDPKLCVVISPEFAKSLGETLIKTIEKYEHVFGPLRPQPTQQQLNEKLPG